MPTFNWIGKEKIVNHDKDVPFRLLKKDAKLSLGKSENLIVEGDNLEALKALMPFYYGRVKCIYIDSPYNTGNEKWVYNDKVNSPKIKEWLGKVVGAEGEDLTRHDKWLCMMYPRLKLLRDLLSDDGVIFVSIDDNELYNLGIMMDEIFGEDKFYALLTWINRTKPKNMGEARFNIQQNTEYVLVYGRITMTKHPRFNLFKAEEKTYPYKDRLGRYRIEEIVQRRNLGTLRRDTMLYPLLGIKPKKGYRWQLSTKMYTELLKKKRIKLINEKPYEIIYDFEEDIFAYSPFWSHFEDVGTAEGGKAELRDILGVGHGFETVKPVELIKRIIFHSTSKSDIILDSFAGSGTTAHAVMELNKEDNGNRKFILVEMEKDICRNITAERVRRVAKGYSYKKANNETIEVQGLGSGFEYAHLGETLFNKDGMINESVSFEDMARYIYFTETHTNLEKKTIKGNYLGTSGDAHYFLLFDGIGRNCLDKKLIKEIKSKKGKKVIYADKCLIDDDVLEESQIVFKQIPYSVKVY